ncbi:MAG: S8 family serine peptidase [Thermaerobacter sp.]|nr:S8 family serine peptidase [Thermaerobacter sp.]
MRRRVWALFGAVLLILPAIPASAAYVGTYAETQPFLLSGKGVALPGDAFYNGRNYAPVTLIYDSHVYIAVRYVAQLAGVTIGWQPRYQMITLRDGRMRLPRASGRRPDFIGPFEVQARYLRLEVNGKERTPAGRTFQVGSRHLPDALYALNTSYMPVSLIAGVLGMRMTWPARTPAAGGFRVSIYLPVRSLVPGSVLGVAATVAGARPGDSLGYVWTMRDPAGDSAPLMGGDHSQQESVPIGANAPRGGYTLEVTATDGRTGQRASASVHFVVSGSPPQGLSVPPLGFSPQTIARAYDIYNTWIGGDFGQGNEIVLYERQGFAPSDLTTFDNAFGLPPPNISVIHPGGPALAPGLEATMDIEWAHAIAPLAQILVVEDVSGGSAQSFPQDLANSLQGAAFDGATIASVSYGVPQNAQQDRQPGQTLQGLLDRGMSIFAAGGDNLDTTGPPPIVWPAADPSTVAVGGTSLFERSPASYFETYWNGLYSASSYGNTIFAAPYWQEELSGSPLRSVPDVSFVGNVQTPVSVYMQGSWWVAGGTSLGAPAWAAIWALVRTAVPAVGNAARAVYTVASSRYDTSALHTPNRTRFDVRTGVGSPDVANLISALRALY